MQQPRPAPFVAIACGGTGGHLFPGVAIAEELTGRGARVLLLVSSKEIDQEAVRSLRGIEVATLPAVGLVRGGLFRFLTGFLKSYRASRALFRVRRPDAVLAMGGFTSAPPVLAGRAAGALAFLHESNSIPGRANRWLAHVVAEAFVYFHESSGRMNLQAISVTGMPVRRQFSGGDPASSRMALGLRPSDPVLLVMGGSQGAGGINRAVMAAVPELIRQFPSLQFIHLTGTADCAAVTEFYRAQPCRSLVRPFLTEMELAMSAATAAISRAGASSLAEIAALRLPSLLVPFPAAADDHQYFNARALVEAGAARMILERAATPAAVVLALVPLLEPGAAREAVRSALGAWHHPDAAARIAERILEWVGRPAPEGAHGVPGPSAVGRASRDLERSLA